MTYTGIFTGILAAVGALQLLVFGYQAYKLRETVESAEQQSKAVERSAKAMEDVVSVINYGNQAALRAYLTVTIGGALCQQREIARQALGDAKFEGRPHLINTGNTPARNVLIRTAADILPVPIPKDFTYPLPDAGVGPAGEQGSGVVGSRQQYEIGAAVEDFVADNEVEDIKRGIKRVLCIWGLITYDDMFGGHHTTKFAQALTWWANGAVFGYYIAGQNDAD